MALCLNKYVICILLRFVNFIYSFFYQSKYKVKYLEVFNINLTLSPSPTN